jgi:dipeptidyl aminopeptidase/acylaminoacyl peptidase
MRIVTAQLPPSLILHGDRDDVVPLQQAILFVERARSLGARPVRLVIRHGKGHGWDEFWKSKSDRKAPDA